MAEELRLPATRMRRGMMDAGTRESGRDNTTSASDMVAPPTELAQGPRLSAAAREPIPASVEKTEYLGGTARHMPTDAACAGKVGDGTPDGRYTHHCCLVRRGETAMALAILTNGGDRAAVSRLGAALVARLAADEAPGSGDAPR